MQNVTIYEIAAMTGVSPSTVSRVINNKPGVKEATKKRVLECLEEHHYSPNEAARGLVNQSSRMIGILITDMRTLHHTEGVAYIQREFSKLGYFCLIMNAGHGDEEKARYIQMLNQRRVEAAVLMGSTFQSEPVRRAIEEYLPRIPIVISNGYIDLPNVYGIIADERNGIFDCVRLLAEKNCHHLAYLYDYDTPSNLLKGEGFQDGTRQFLREEHPRILRVDNDFDRIYEATQTLMREHPETDGLIFAEDPMAAAGLRALLDMGIRVPGQVKLIGVNNSTITRICNPSLTSLDNQLFELSIAASRNLSDALTGKPVVKKMMVYSHIEERETT